MTRIDNELVAKAVCSQITEKADNLHLVRIYGNNFPCKYSALIDDKCNAIVMYPTWIEIYSIEEYERLN